MICPYCGKEMQEGYMVSEKDFRWIPKGERWGFFVNIPRDYEVLWIKRKLFRMTKMKVFRCPDCKIDIIDEK